jgi:serine protease Do
MKRISSFFRAPFGSALLGGLVVGVLALIAISAGLVDSKDSTTTTVTQAPLPATQPAADKGDALTVNQIYAHDGAGVVYIQSTQKAAGADPFNPLGGGGQTQTATGSGFVIDTEGHIITNAHVVDGSKDVQVTLTQNGDPIEATVVGEDPSTDVAVLKVDVPADQLHPISLGDASGVQVGDPVVAIGNPYGLDRTVTAGIVSALQRDIQSPNGFTISHAIQTDAPINPGNSGGPLLDAQGRVIGITSQIESSGNGGGNVGIGFAVPIDTAKQIAQELIDKGQVNHAFLGISGADLSPDIADALNLDVNHGALIQSVVPGSPADKAGLSAGNATASIDGARVSAGGDVITQVEGKDVASPKELARLIGAYSPGKSVDVTVWRDGKSQAIKVDLGTLPSTDKQASADPQQPAAPAKPAALADLGLTVTKSENGKGLVVTDVDPDSDAADRGIQPGDVITSVNSTEVNGTEDVAKAMADAVKSGRKAVLMQITRDDSNRFVALPVAKG